MAETPWKWTAIESRGKAKAEPKAEPILVAWFDGDAVPNGWTLMRRKDGRVLGYRVDDSRVVG